MRTNFRLLYRKVGSRELSSVELDLLRGLSVTDLAPARELRNYHGQVQRCGWYFSSKAGRHLQFESRLERLRMQFLDFDPEVTTFAAQPFSLTWQDGGKAYRYTPDLLVVRAGLPRVVEEVKPGAYHHHPRLQPAFEAAREALDPIGVEFRLWEEPPLAMVRNVEYLATYRRIPARLMERLDDILAAVRERPYTLGELAHRLGPAPVVLPHIYHLIWNHRLRADLSVPLSMQTLLLPGLLPGEVA